MKLKIFFLSLMTSVTLFAQPIINDLLPGLVCVPAIRPALPDNYIAMSRREKPNILDSLIWGPKEDVQAFFQDPNSVKQPLIYVKLGGVPQTGPDSFVGEDEFENESNKPKRIKWGSYPLSVYNTEADGDKFYTATLGLNSEGGETLFFILIYPKDENGNPTKEALAFWDQFLNQTVEVSLLEKLKIKGQDLQDTYTILSLNGTELKLVAEQRTSDDKLLVYTERLKGDVKLESDEVGTAKFPNDSRLVARVYGTLTAVNKKKYGTVVMEQANYVFVKPVTEFTKVRRSQIVFEE